MWLSHFVLAEKFSHTRLNYFFIFLHHLFQRIPALANKMMMICYGFFIANSVFWF